MPNELQILATSAGKDFAAKVCNRLLLQLGEARVARFNDGEVDVQILQNVRDRDVFIIGSTNAPAENFVEMALLAEAAHGSSARRITLVMPYLGYNRQDRKDRPRVPVSARTMIKFLAASGANRALLCDLHSEATAPHFHPLVTDHVYASPVAVEYLNARLPRPFAVASPDKGGVPRAEAYAKRLKQDDIVVFSKSRSAPGTVREDSIKIIGDVRGRNVLFVDDIVDSGGTLIADAKAAKKAGAKKVFAFATHAVFSSDPKRVLQAFDKSVLDELVITDSIPHPPNLLKTGRIKLTVLTLSELIAKAIKYIHEGHSLSPLISGAARN